MHINSKIINKRLCWILFFIFGMLFNENFAIAHKAVIFAYVEGDIIHTESKFSGGRKVVNSLVAVYNQKGDKLLEGKTDEHGEFSFRIPEITELKIVLNAGMGHRAEWIVPVEDLLENVVEPSEDTLLTKNVEGREQNDKTGSESTRHVKDAVRITMPELQEVIENALDKKMRPIMKMLAESRQEGPTIQDIFGGIGYIFGLMGIAAYFHYRKKGDFHKND